MKNKEKKTIYKAQISRGRTNAEYNIYFLSNKHTKK